MNNVVEDEFYKLYKKKYGLFVSTITVKEERFLKMVQTQQLDVVYNEETKTIQFRPIANNSTGADKLDVAGLEKLNRIANKQKYLKLLDVEDFIVSQLNNKHDLLAWRLLLKAR